MTTDLVLKPLCERCGSSSDLYGSNCKHLTLCLACGKAMAENRAKCNFCFVVISRLIRNESRFRKYENLQSDLKHMHRMWLETFYSSWITFFPLHEYNVRASTSTDKALCIGRFITGLPPFSRKKSAENKWTLHEEGIQGRPLTNNLREKNKNKTLVLEDETGQHQYQGQQLKGAQAATYYLLILHGKEFLAVPARSWHNFNKIAQYKQLSLEEAEEKMNRRRNNATGYQRWMMKAATNGPAAFGEVNRDEVLNGGSSGNYRPKKGKSNGDQTHSGKDEENMEQEEARKNRLTPIKKRTDYDDDEDEGTIKGVYDMDDDDIEKGDDWEHEETFTDDDETVGNNPEEWDDLSSELPAPPEIKQDDEDEGDEEGGLSKSGKELKKLLGRVVGQNESDADDQDDMDDDNGMSPVLAPRQRAVKAEPAENSPSKPLPTGSFWETPTTKSSKAKQKPGSDHIKSPNGAPTKKTKTDNDSRLASIKDEPLSFPTSNVSPKVSTLAASKTRLSPFVAPVTIDDIRDVLLSAGPLTTQDLVARFKGRLKSREDKSVFADMLKKISRMQKTNGVNFVVLRDE